ncbi:MAG: hypothetical protein ACRCTD_03315 [Beijerinckiaceae bacterium]
MTEQDRQAADDVQRVATGFITEAFAEGQAIGLDGDAMAHAALCTALRELVATYGEEPVAVFANGLAEKIRHGRYSDAVRH